jgi:hypothetical protein
MFLDFDGVLHRPPPPLGQLLSPDLSVREAYTRARDGYIEQQFCWLPILRDIVSQAHVDLFVHSSWRLWYDHGDLRQRFAGDDALRLALIGFTVGEERYESIVTTVVELDITDYLILDDEPEHFPAECPQLLVCQPYLGISDPRVQERILQWIGPVR